jgi:hypothetical protein
MPSCGVSQRQRRTGSGGSHGGSGETGRADEHHQLRLVPASNAAAPGKRPA